LTKVVYDDALR